MVLEDENFLDRFIELRSKSYGARVYLGKGVAELCSFGPDGLVEDSAPFDFPRALREMEGILGSDRYHEIIASANRGEVVSKSFGSYWFNVNYSEGKV